MTTTTPQADARRLVVTSAADGGRLDRYVQSQCADLSRSRVAVLTREGHVTLNGATAKPASLVHGGDVVEVVVGDVVIETLGVGVDRIVFFYRPQVPFAQVGGHVTG